MARALDAVWILTGTLQAVSPVGIGGLDGATDLPVARDGLGRPYVPGPTLAGVIRAALGRTEGNPALNHLFGRGLDLRDGGFASHLRVADAVLENASVERRDGVALDRFSGSAADNFFYVREVVAAGAHLALQIEVEVPTAQGTEDEKAMVELRSRAEHIDALMPVLAGLLAAEGLVVGAGSGRGLGRLHPVGALRLLRMDLSRRDHLRAWWTWRAARCLEVVPTGAARVSQRPASDDRRWTFKIHWVPAGPVMVKSGAEGTKVQQLPLCTRAIDGQWHAVLPGSALRGALRAHAERIVRTVRPGALALPLGLKEQVRVQVVDDLFGRARAQGEEVARGALSVRDCFHGQGLADAPRGRAVADAPVGWHTATHVAIDRWTGGALDSALFSVLEPAWEDADHPGWEPMVLEVDLHRHEADGARSLALLWLVLRDLCQGWVPLGFGTRRGMGAVKIIRIEAYHGEERLPDLDAEMAPLPREWKTNVDIWEAAWHRFLEE